MAIKLGELLLNEKLITPEQLNEALKHQTVFGIKLGSSLVEMGVISEEQLCGFLSSKLEVPAVSPRAMSFIPLDVLSLVPANLAKKYRVVPIRIEGKKLSLAMEDPTDFKAIDEVAFVTGCVILPHIAPDVRITAALSKHYQIRGDMRYLRMEGELADQRRNAPVAETVKKAEKIEFSMVNDNGELLNIEIPLEFEGFATIPDYEDNPLATVAGVDRYTVDRLSLEFASAKNRDQIANVFIKYLGQEFRVGALFMIRNNVAVGWRGVTAGKRIEQLESLSILLDKPSVMKQVHETGQFFIGSLVQNSENIQLLKTLEVGSDTPLLVLPIVMLKKVVAVVIVSAELEALGTRLQELQKLVYKASLAFEMLIIKNKILMT